MCFKNWLLELVTCLPLWVSSLVLCLWWVRLLVVACHSERSLATHFHQLLVCLLSVQANKELVKDVLTCRPLESSVYKACHPDDTDDPDAVGVSSEDEAEGMEDILGVTRRLNKPSPPESPQPSPAVPEEEGMIRVSKKDLKRAQGISKDILAGKKVHASTGATHEDVPFEVPVVKAGKLTVSCVTRASKTPAPSASI